MQPLPSTAALQPKNHDADVLSRLTSVFRLHCRVCFGRRLRLQAGAHWSSGGRDLMNA